MTDFLNAFKRSVFGATSPEQSPKASDSGFAFVPVAHCDSGSLQMPPKMTPMGQAPVTAEAAAPAADAAAAAIPAAPAAPAAAAGAAAEAAAASARPQPGEYEKAESAQQQILNQDTFDGLRFEIAKPLNPHFSLSHSVWMGTRMVPEGSLYHFSASVQDSNYYLTGRTNPSAGSVDATCIYSVTPQLRTRCDAQMVAEAGRSFYKADVDYLGSDYSASLQVTSLPYAAGSYWQSVTKNLAVGGQLLHMFGNRKDTVVTAKARYTSDGGNHVLFAHGMSRGVLQTGYVHRINQKVGLATDFQYDHGSGESACNVGYDFTFRAARLQAKINNTGVITASLTEQINPGFSMMFSAQMDHSKSNYVFGYGVTMGQ